MIGMNDILTGAALSVSCCSAAWLLYRNSNATMAERCSLSMLVMWAGTFGVSGLMSDDLWTALASPMGPVYWVLMLIMVLGGIPYGLMCDNAPRPVLQRFYRGMAVCLLTVAAGAWLFV